MAYYEISKRDELRDDYPRAFQNAIKNAYKAKRYDKVGEKLLPHSAYINELKADIMREAQFFIETESWRKAVTYAKYVIRIDPQDLGALLLKGVAETKSRNEYQAKATFEESREILESVNPEVVVNHNTKSYYLFSLLKYADLMKTKGEPQEATPYLDAFSTTYANDAEFEKFYEGY